MSLTIARPLFLAALLVTTGAAAGERGYAPAHAGYGAAYAGGYGFADEAVRGAYIGAPLTRFPRPSEIVPPAWSYGTYGVPTISGIPRAPVGEPTVTVINPHETAPRRARGGPRILSRDGGGDWVQRNGLDQPAGARVIAVRVPRR